MKALLVAACWQLGRSLRPGAAAGRLALETTGCVKEGRCPLYTVHNVTVPRAQEVHDFVDKLQYIRETELPDKVTAREAAIIRESMKLSLLAYGRNDAKGLAYHAFFDKEGYLEILELQMKGLQHQQGEVDDAAHLVAYLVRDYDRSTGLENGFGVVLSYKGSTNSGDWKANFKSRSVPMFPDLPEDKTMVHQGFLTMKKNVDERMEKAPMQPLQESLKLWGVETTADNFMSFLHEAKWNWCICTGHSMGGAQSAISALDLAVRTKEVRQERQQPIFAVGIAAAIPGSKSFCDDMTRLVKPHGGLRIENKGDVVTFLGYGKVTFKRSNRVVFGYHWTLTHSHFRTLFKKLANHIQFDIDDGRGRLTRYLFSTMGNTLISNPEQAGNLKMTTLLEHE